MKRVSIFIVAFVMIAGVVRADYNALFSVDRPNVESQMASLDRLEQYVEANRGVTLDELERENNAALRGTSLSSVDAIHLLEGPAGIPSFLWGCILSWVGILIVYLITEDSEETKKALIGCIVGAVSGCILYFVFWLVVWGAAWGTWWWY